MLRWVSVRAYGVDGMGDRPDISSSPYIENAIIQ